MTTHPATPPTTVPAWRSFAETMLTLLGAISVFLGAFILLAGDDHSVGLFGEWSWQVGDISPWWGIGLIVGGAIALAVALASVIARRTR